MRSITRRNFLAGAAVASAAALTGRSAKAEETTSKIKSGADQVTLGRSGVKTSVLGLGTGTHGVRRSSNQQKLGQAKFTALVRHAYDKGIRYFDTADQYGMHIFLREALKGAPRDDLFIQTKVRQTHPEAAKADIERFRQELQMDTIDSLLMHCMQKATWTTDLRPVMDVMFEAKEKERVRAVGISCHGMDPLAASPACDWIDVQLARINPFSAAMDGPPEKVVEQLKKLHDAGKGVIGMKICGGGKKTGPEERLESLKFVLGLGCVDAFTIGFESPRQIDEVLAQIETVLK